MSTINHILKEHGYTKETLSKACKGICNGCGGKGGVDFNKLMQSLPYFNTQKGLQLEIDIKYLCYIHDLIYNKGGGILTFIKSNYRLAYNICKLLHWTNSLARLFIFIIVFAGTSTFGVKYFNWYKKKNVN